MKIYVLRLGTLRRIGRILFVFTAFILLITVCTYGTFALLDSEMYVPAGAADVGRVIIIDAGHGGEDSGAVGVNGCYEKDLNLSIAMCLGEILTEKGYTVVYTRTEDRMLYSEDENIKGMRKLSDLKNRCKVAELYPDSIFISIHMNSFGASKYSGLQVYYTDGNDESLRLATSVQSNVKENLLTENNRTVKNGKSLYILENCPVTSVLIECGFITNETECKNLSEKEYQKQLSFAIVCGIIEYIEKTPEVTEP